MDSELKLLDIRDIAIIDALPNFAYEKTILNVGCGEGRIDYHLASMGYRVFATDIKEHDTWREMNNLTFHDSNILYLPSFPVKVAPVVICSQVLEHIKDYKTALSNLLKLTEIRLILTFPFKKSFYSLDHVNFWDDSNIQEFAVSCRPYSVSISRISTKFEDVARRQSNYLLIIDKRQKLHE